MPTYPVTGTLTDLGLEPLTGLNPVLVFFPPESIALTTGHISVTEPVEVEPDSTGAFTAELASTDDLVGRGQRWRVALGWRDPDTFGASGHTRYDHPRWKIAVPRGGGRLVDMLDQPVAQDVLAVALLAPETEQQVAEELYARGVRLVIDNSTTPAALYRLEA